MCMSCSDVEINNIEFRNTTIGQQDNQQNHQDDACSSLCVCNCCGRIVMLEKITSIFTSETFPKALVALKFNFTPIFYFNYFGSIWQPPQIC